MIHRLIIALAMLITASPAFAEVSDKEPSIERLWAFALGFSVVALLLEVVRRRLGLLVVPIAAFFAWAGHTELSDPFVGPDILSELGPSYVDSAYASFAVGLLGPLIVVLLFSLFRRRSTSVAKSENSLNQSSNS